MKKWIVGAMIVLASISAVGADTTKGMSVKNGNVLVGTVNDNGAKLQVTGDVSVNGNITSSGIISGSVLKYNNADINSNQALSNVAYLDKTNTFSQGQIVNGNIDSSGILKTTNITQATSAGNGALIVSGGAGIGGNIYSGGNAIELSSSNNIANFIKVKNTSLGISGGSQLLVENDNAVMGGISSFSSNRTTGVFGTTLANVVGVLSDSPNLSSMMIGTLVSKPLLIGTNNNKVIEISETGVTNFKNTSASTGVGSGSAVLAGGISVGKDSYFGGHTTMTAGYQDRHEYAYAGEYTFLTGTTNGNGILVLGGHNGASNAFSSSVETVDGSADMAFKSSRAGYPRVGGTIPSLTENMRIKGATGNVLIGTTNDDNTNKLQINGSLFVPQGAKINLYDSSIRTFEQALDDQSNIRPLQIGTTRDYVSPRSVTVGSYSGYDFKTVMGIETITGNTSFYSGKVAIGGKIETSGANLQVNGTAKITSLSGSGIRILTTDDSGKLIASYDEKKTGVYTTFNSGAGDYLFATMTNGIPMFGELFAYDTANRSKFCKYSLYKADESSQPVYQLIQNNGLLIQAVNFQGTLCLNDTSTTIRMEVKKWELINK